MTDDPTMPACCAEAVRTALADEVLNCAKHAVYFRPGVTCPLCLEEARAEGWGAALKNAVQWALAYSRDCGCGRRIAAGIGALMEKAET